MITIVYTKIGPSDQQRVMVKALSYSLRPRLDLAYKA